MDYLSTKLPSRPGDFHPEPLTDPDLSLSTHPARATARRQSAPLRRIGTFGLAVVAACAFSLGIAGQVLTFHTGARSSFALPTRRMPLGRYLDIRSWARLSMRAMIERNAMVQHTTK